MCVNSLFQGLIVDLPKAGLEPRTLAPKAERLPLDHDATQVVVVEVVAVAAAVVVVVVTIVVIVVVAVVVGGGG
ncbi:hypothetical protein ElyMa_000060500 [Elysia marginata]|uniref:Uncharacterized protein n=1 Tax=Elysia marginata TaxID=1093978 RepID=A0AAV4EGT1_9GAST|nr:hypothetical protein ElyMa_000060500 [Elysia marginata]